MNLSEQPCPQCKQSYNGLSIESSSELKVSRIKCAECGFNYSKECCEEDLLEKFKAEFVTNPYSKTQGHHCWWLNKNGKALANFNDEKEVDNIIKMYNMIEKLHWQMSLGN